MEKDKQQKMWVNGVLWVLVNTFSWLLYILISMATGWLVWETYQVLTDQMFIPFLSDETNRMLLTLILLGVGWGGVIGFLQQTLLKKRFDLDGRSWIFATCIGMTLYMLFSQIYLITYDIRILQSYSYGLSIFASFSSSALLGTAQWIILRRTLNRAGFWVLATVIALGVSPLVMSLFNFGWVGGNGSNYMIYTAIFYLITGFVYGLITWISLILMSGQSIKTLETQQELVN